MTDENMLKGGTILDVISFEKEYFGKLYPIESEHDEIVEKAIDLVDTVRAAFKGDEFGKFLIRNIKDTTKDVTGKTIRMTHAMKYKKQ